MENQYLIKKIQSSYIIKNIFNYIKDKNFILKIFIHSKLFQKKLELTIIYKEKYIDKIGFDIKKLLHIEQEKYEKDYLIKKYNNFLFENKLNKKEFENILSDIIKYIIVKNINKENNIKKDSEILIDI